MKRLYLLAITIFSCMLFNACPTLNFNPHPSGTFIGDPDLSPEIDITETDSRVVRGSVRNVDLEEMQVVLWVHDGGSELRDLHPDINQDGRWSQVIPNLRRALALLVDRTYVRRSRVIDEMVGDPGVLAWVIYPRSSDQ